MKDMKPLTSAEKEFAQKHHNLVYSFLYLQRLSPDEYYDVVIFRYLRSVKRYLTIESLQRYSFTTVAYAAMRSAIGNYRSSLRRKQTTSLDEPLSDDTKLTLLDTIPDISIDVEETVEDKTAIASLHRNQRCLTVLAIQGYSFREISNYTSMPIEKIRASLLSAQRQIQQVERCE